MANRTSDKPSNHVCPDCGRAYKAAETMNRHRKNHSETSQYVCSICAASFKRKDLLDRHSQIHIGGRQTASRNRSQRACDRCSRLKTRCDNANPCTRCTKAGHECTYKHVRTRARIDRSSIHSSGTSASSSVHSSPHLKPIDFEPVTCEPLSPPEPGPPTFTTPNYLADSTWTQDLWMPEPSWPWADNLNIHEGMGLSNADLKTFRGSQPAPLKHDPETSAFLDPALKTSARCPPPAAMGPLYDDPTANMSWYQRHAVQAGTAAVDSGCSDFSETLSHPGSDHRHASPDLHSFESVQSQQKHIVSELATFSTAAFGTGANYPEERVQYWQQSALEVEGAFGLRGIAPAGSHVFQHFHDLFFRYFPASWPINEKSFAVSTPPHLYLTMAAIGAAYAGPRAEGFHRQLMDVLRPKIMLAAVERHLSDEATLLLIQSLALLQSAMLCFADRRALDASPQLAAITTSLCRRVQLFDDAKFVQAQNYLGSGMSSMNRDIRKQLAGGVRRLDAQVAELFGTRPLLTEVEERLCNTAKHHGVLDQLV